MNKNPYKKILKVLLMIRETMVIADSNSIGIDSREFDSYEDFLSSRGILERFDRDGVIKLSAGSFIYDEDLGDGNNVSLYNFVVNKDRFPKYFNKIKSLANKFDDDNKEQAETEPETATEPREIQYIKFKLNKNCIITDQKIVTISSTEAKVLSKVKPVQNNVKLSELEEKSNAGYSFETLAFDLGSSEQKVKNIIDALNVKLKTLSFRVMTTRGNSRKIRLVRSPDK